ncbi:MAG: LysR family transcriptional regulator [Betaproteobacteria bacterium]|jgi:LysR family glycine cleavage system transcriptional activator|nr:LysR substrate-binding domain-containing protein [Rubrivivax sp.]
MNTRLPSVDGLRAFEAAARLGSFERAADELHVTASAVSKRVAVLEELVGAPLFVRGARALQLTEAGRDYLGPASHVLGLLMAMPQHRRGAPRRERLRVSVPPTFARQVLMPRLAGFTDAHPDVELELLLSLPQLDLAATEADLEVRFGSAGTGAPLLRERVLPLAAPALCAALGERPGPPALARVPLLRSPLEPWTPWFRAAGLPWPEPQAGPRLADLGLVLEAAIAGQGVALARPSLARPALAGGALRAPWALAAEPAHQYYLLPHAADGPAAAFAGWLRDTCSEAAREAQALLSGVT